MSASIWQLKKGDRFISELNGDFFFVDVNWKGIYWSNKTLVSKAKENLELQGVKDLELYRTSEEEYTQGIMSTTTKYAIQLDSIAVGLGLLGYSIPTMSQLNKNLKTFLLNSSQKIKDVNPHFRDFLRKKEDDTDDVQGEYVRFIESVASVELYECGNLSDIIKAYKKDPKSIIGIANKVNKG